MTTRLDRWLFVALLEADSAALVDRFDSAALDDATGQFVGGVVLRQCRAATVRTPANITNAEFFIVFRLWLIDQFPFTMSGRGQLLSK